MVTGIIICEHLLMKYQMKDTSSEGYSTSWEPCYTGETTSPAAKLCLSKERKKDIMNKVEEAMQEDVQPCILTTSAFSPERGILSLVPCFSVDQEWCKSTTISIGMTTSTLLHFPLLKYMKAYIKAFVSCALPDQGRLLWGEITFLH